VSQDSHLKVASCFIASASSCSLSVHSVPGLCHLAHITSSQFIIHHSLSLSLQT